MSDQNSLPNLWDTVSTNVPLPDIILSSSDNNEQLTATVVVKCLTVTNGSGVNFFVLAYLTINPQKYYIYSDQNERPYRIGEYATEYDINIYPTDYRSDPKFRVVSSEPSTGIGVTTIGFGDSISFSGNVGVFGGLPAAQGSAGYSVSSSTSIDIPDVSYKNQSRSAGCNSELTFTMPIDETKNTILSDEIDPPKPIQVSLFETATATYWNWAPDNLDEESSGFMNFTVEVSATLTSTKLRPSGIPLVGELDAINITNNFSGSTTFSMQYVAQSPSTT